MPNYFTTIPTVIHSIYHSEVEKLTLETVTGQIDVLNADFTARGAGIDNIPVSLRGNPMIEFNLATVDPLGRETQGVTWTKTEKAYFTDASEVKRTATAWPADVYLNIWVCQFESEQTGGPVLGNATPPGWHELAEEGIIIDINSFGKLAAHVPMNPAFPFFDLYYYISQTRSDGKTATHEVGHYFGLNHSWQNTSGVTDLPNQTEPSASNWVELASKFGHCPSLEDKGGNYMDYLPDKCMWYFSPNQATVMQNTLGVKRKSLVFSETERMRIADFRGRSPSFTPLSSWTSTTFNGWQDDGDQQFAGDFLGLGYDQVLFFNLFTATGEPVQRGSSAGRVKLMDFSGSQPESRYDESWNDDDGPFQVTFVKGNMQHVGDVRGFGRDQILWIRVSNRTSGVHQLCVISFDDGPTPGSWSPKREHRRLGEVKYHPGDLQLVGDFMNQGHDQILFVSRDKKVEWFLKILDLSGNYYDARTLYTFKKGQSTQFGGWLNEGDLAYVGDYMNLGYDQLLLYNTGPSKTGRLKIVDFSQNGRVLYFESYGESTTFNGWFDPGDLQFVGDFKGSGHDQLLLVNNGGTGGRLGLIDFSSGQPVFVDISSRSSSSVIPYNTQESKSWNGWFAAKNTHLVGRSIHDPVSPQQACDQLFSINSSWNIWRKPPEGAPDS